MGSTGAIIGGIVGGIVGFFVGGGPLGAVYGFAIGYGIGTIVDPMTPDVPPPGKPQVGKLNITTADEGLPIADALGTTKITGNIIWYANNRTVEIPPPQQEQGKGSVIGPAVGQATGQGAQGYHYYLTWANGICSGPVDTLYTIYKGDDCVWEGSLDRPESGGEETLSIPDIGSMTFFFGTDDQVAPAAMTNLLEDPTLSPDYKRLCYAFFNDGYLGQYNRLPIFKFVFKKSPPLAFNDNKEMETYFYNPAHGVYYVLTQMIGLDPQYINNATFSSEADKLFLEDRGVNILFDRQAPALSYLETILHHVDGVLRWGIDGRLHLKLMRADEDTAIMQVVTEDIMIGDLNFERKSWLDTQNEIKVQYPLLVVGDCELCLLEETDAPFVEQVGENGDVGNYEITEGCPPFDVYIRRQSSPWGEWVFRRTVVGREFNETGGYIGCQAEDIFRQLKVVDSFDRDSNFLNINIWHTTEMVWGGDQTVNVSEGSVDISWAYGSPPFSLQTDNPLLTFDEQNYSQFLQTGLRTVTVYFTAQACGNYNVSIKDKCGQIITGGIFVSTGYRWKGEDSDPDIGPSDTAVVVWENGIGPYDIELVGQFEDIWLDEEMTITSLTSFPGEGTTLYSGPDACGDVEVQVTDQCEVTIFGQVSGPGLCYYLIWVQLYTGFGIDGSSVVLLWDPNTNAKAIFAKNSSGDLGDNPASSGEFTYATAGNHRTNDIDYIHPYGKNGYNGILGAAAIYGKDPDEQMQAPIAISSCVFGSTHTCEFWDVNAATLTDLCSATFTDQTPPDDNFMWDQDLTEFGFMSANPNAHFDEIPGHIDYQDTAHLLKVRDQRDYQQVVGEDPGDRVDQYWNYDIDLEFIAPVTGTTKKVNLSGSFNRWKANRAANWNAGGNYTSGSARVPYIQEHMNGGYCHGIFASEREQVAGAFCHTLGLFSMDKWYPYPNQYITLNHYATAGYDRVPDIDIETVDVTTMYGRNTGFENAIEELMQFWYDHNGYDTVDIEASDLFDDKMWPEVKMHWITQLNWPATTTTTTV